MKDPELRGPHEWANEARDRAENEFGERAWMLTATDCREIADRMDDLTEALRLLRNIRRNGDGSPVTAALLAKYEED